MSSSLIGAHLVGRAKIQVRTADFQRFFGLHSTLGAMLSGQKRQHRGRFLRPHLARSKLPKWRQFLCVLGLLLRRESGSGEVSKRTEPPAGRSLYSPHRLLPRALLRRKIESQPSAAPGRFAADGLRPYDFSAADVLLSFCCAEGASGGT